MGKKEERKNGQTRREINVTKYMENDQFLGNLEHLNNPEKNKVLHLIDKYREVFVKHKFDVGTVKFQETSIKLIENKNV